MKLSIVTINFNAADGLQRTLDSVAKQVVGNFEHIIIDGGSRDDSLQVLQEYEQGKKDYDIRWISEKDSGVYDAMNKGIRMATGDYIIFMNAGDAFADENVLRDLVPELEGDLVSGYVEEDVTGRIIAPPKQWTLRHLLKQNIPHQAEFIRRELFYEIGMYSDDLKIIADYEFNMKCLMRNCTLKVVDRKAANVEPGGLSNTQYAQLEEEHNIVCERIIPFGVRADYNLWMNHQTYSHPALPWAFENKWPAVLLKGLYKYDEFIRFCIVGVLATGIHYGLY